MIRRLATLVVLVWLCVLPLSPLAARRAPAPAWRPLVPPRQTLGPAGAALMPRGADSNVNTTHQPSAQNETSIAVHPLDHRVLVGGANDYRTAPNGDSNCGYTHSSDGGVTWTSGILAGITSGGGGPFDYDAAGDPSVYYAADGTVFYACLAFDRTYARSAMLITHSSNGGSTWITPTAIITSESSTAFEDKEILTIDTSAASPYLGRLHSAWTVWSDFTQTPITATLVAAYSSDQGATWSTPALLSGQGTAAEGASPAVGPDGTLYVAWCEASEDCGTQAQASILLNRSTDGGVSWGLPLTVTTFTDVPSPLPGNLFRLNSFPTTAVHPLTGDVYIAYAAYDSGNADILLTRSTDHGATWSAPVVVNSHTADDQFFQWMAFSPHGALWVCYYDQSWNMTNWLDTSCSQMTGDLVFAPAVRVTTVSSDPGFDGFGGQFIGDYTGLAVDADNVPHPLWTDTRTGNAEAFTWTWRTIFLPLLQR